jgi:hypothetical protein
MDTLNKQQIKQIIGAYEQMSESIREQDIQTALAMCDANFMDLDIDRYCKKVMGLNINLLDIDAIIFGRAYHLYPTPYGMVNRFGKHPYDALVDRINILTNYLNKQ